MKKLPSGINKKTLSLASLHQITRILGASFNLDKLLNLILTTIIKETRADSGSLMLLDEETHELFITAYRGISKSIAAKTRIKLGQGISGIVAQRRKPLLINNKNFYSIFGKKPRKKLKSSLSIPLIISDKIIGVINLNRIPGSEEFTSGDLKAISIFADESAIAINNARLYIAAEEKIQHLFRFNVISCALNTALDFAALIDILTDCICELFIFNFYTLLLVEDNKCSLLVGSKNKIHKQFLNNLRRNLALLASGIKKEKVNSKQIEIIHKNVSIKSAGKKAGIIKNIGSVINAPIIAKGKPLGMLSVYSTEKRGFRQKDQQSLSTLANQAAVALENANLYKNLRQTYLSTIKALAQAIEEKDVYTRGHSELVSQYAVSIAQALQLPSKMVEGIQIAGILHDIGKIGIPEKILSKPAALTYNEYEIIKRHPRIGKRILEPVNFFWADPAKASKSQSEKRVLKMQPIIQSLKRIKPPVELTLDILKTADISAEIKRMIYHHHERYGGKGYPDGIKGEKIPIGSRILAVADTFEAMTADRPYRKAFPVKKALKLLKECTPNQLDPQIVNIFTKIVKKGWVRTKKIDK